MNDTVNEILARIHQLEDKIEEEFVKNRAAFKVRLHGRIADFAEDVIEKQKEFKIRLPQFFLHAKILHILVAPVIYSLIVPIVLIDLWATIYQHICFRAYGIPRVKRSTYIIVDRHHLAYLNPVEKMNCLYCGYGNGVFSYVREIASRSEQYWCPIKHAIRVRDPHERYLKFVDYGDAKSYRESLADYREDVRKSD